MKRVNEYRRERPFCGEFPKCGRVDPLVGLHLALMAARFGFNSGAVYLNELVAAGRGCLDMREELELLHRDADFLVHLADPGISVLLSGAKVSADAFPMERKGVFVDASFLDHESPVGTEHEHVHGPMQQVLPVNAGASLGTNLAVVIIDDCEQFVW